MTMPCCPCCCCCCSCCCSQYVEVIGHLHDEGSLQEFKSTDFGDSFGELNCYEVLHYYCSNRYLNVNIIHGTPAKHALCLYYCRYGTLIIEIPRYSDSSKCAEYHVASCSEVFLVRRFWREVVEYVTMPCLSVSDCRWSNIRVSRWSSENDSPVYARYFFGSCEIAWLTHNGVPQVHPRRYHAGS